MDLVQAMKIRLRIGLRAMLVVVGVSGIADPGLAGGVVNARWGGCSDIALIDQTTHEGVAQNLAVWVQGQEEGHQGYDLTVKWAPADGPPLPDAWRFESAGCQPASALEVVTQNPVPSRAGCWSGLSEPNTFYRTTTLTYDEPTGMSALRVEVSYPDGVSEVSPFVRYLAARLIFEVANTSRYGVTTNPGTCGGFERPLCFKVTNARYQNLSGDWIPWTLGSVVATTHGDGVPVPDCQVVPAAARTWGQIKAWYR